MRKLDFSPRWDATKGYKNLKQWDLKISPRQYDKKGNLRCVCLIFPIQDMILVSYLETRRNKPKQEKSVIRRSLIFSPLSFFHFIRQYIWFGGKWSGTSGFFFPFISSESPPLRLNTFPEQTNVSYIGRKLLKVFLLDNLFENFRTCSNPTKINKPGNCVSNTLK